MQLIKYCTLIVFCFFLNSIVAQSNLQNYTACFEKNSIILNKEKKQFDVKKLNLITGKNYFFFLGETHYNRANINALDLLVNNLSDSFNVRVVVLELASCWQEDFNNYVISGDERCLSKIKNYWDINQLNEEVIPKLDAILKVNRNLKDEKIQVKCIDVIQNRYFAFEELVRIIEKKGIPHEKIKEDVNEVVETNRKTKISIKNTRQLANKLLIRIKSESLFQDYLSEDYNNFINILKGLTLTNDRKNLSDKDFYARETLLFENFVEVIRENPNVSMICQFGSLHTTFSPIVKTYNGKWQPFVKTLCDSLNLKENIRLFNMLYQNKPYPIDKDYGKHNVEIIREYFYNKEAIIDMKCFDTPEKRYSEIFQYIYWVND